MHEHERWGESYRRKNRKSTARGSRAAPFHCFGYCNSLVRIVGKSWKWLSSDYYRDVGQRSRMCPLLGNRGNRSLGAPLTHVEGSTYLGPRKPVTPQRSYAHGVHVHARPSELLSLSPCVSQTSPNSLLNERSLELCHGADDLEHESPGRRAEIEIIAEADKGDAVGAKVCEGVNQMFQ